MSCSGGPWTSDHVDVLGNHGLLDLLLHVASGNGDKVLPGRPLCL